MSCLPVWSSSNYTELHTASVDSTHTGTTRKETIANTSDVFTGIQNILLSIVILLLFSLYLTYNTQDSLIESEGSDKVSRTRTPRPVHGHNAGDDSDNVVQQRNILEGLEQEEEEGEEEEVVVKDEEEKPPIESTLLYKYLQQLEQTYLDDVNDVRKIVKVKGQEDVIARDLPLYEQAFKKRHFAMKAPPWYKPTVANATSNNAKNNMQPVTLPHESEWVGWMVLLCMAFTDGDGAECLEKESFPKLANYQKINRIPGIRNILWRKDGFCNTMNQARRIPALKKSQISPLCWVLPNQYEQFLGVADGLGTDVRWVFKSTSPGGTIQVLQPTKERDYAKVKQFNNKKTVVQEYFPNPLLVFGMPVNIRAYVLVTSINPLRAFVHSEGLVHFRHDYPRGFKKIPNRTWFLAQFKHFLVHNFGTEAAEIAFQNMEAAIVETLLIAESSLAAHFGAFTTHPWEERYRCKNCFQLLGFDVIFNSTLHPMVVEVNGQPYLQANSEVGGWASNTIKQNAVEDTVGILFSATPVARDVAEAVRSMQLNNVGITGVNCHSSHHLCLTNEDLLYLLDSRREAINKASFRQLYPAKDSFKYDSLVRDLQRFVASQYHLNDISPYNQMGAHATSPTTRHNTADLQNVISNVEQYYYRKKKWRRCLREMNGASIPEHFGNRTYGASRRSGLGDGAINNMFNLDPLFGDPKYDRPPCNDDPATMPFLSAFHFDPPLNLTPTFDPMVTEYEATVPHDMVLIKVWGFATSCDSEARLEDKLGASRPSNYTLGVGENRISMFVVDITHSEPWVSNSYTVNVYRQSVEEGEEQTWEDDQPHHVCSLVQDCDLPFISDGPCGLNRVLDVRWPDVIVDQQKLPVCESGNSPGRWLIPCSQCSNKSSCYWKEARWLPYDCRHQILPRQQLRQCLAGKDLLFIGDSTNRGIMYYIMEQLNGTLTEWDKTHNIKVYSNLNNNQTSVSFAYYPQFWLPAGERPVFDKALYELLKHSKAAKNNGDTVVVVGGVHWLATHHLNVLKQALKRKGLSNVKLVMKGLGAGFHQPVDGIHCLTMGEQRKVFIHNTGLLDYASNAGFEVVDTFNMTMARYKDFVQGKCACHFHKVEEVRPTDDPDDYDNILYHVTGDINSLYSEILINRICQ
ncbi:LOW QUALITY PROTEIN: cadherin-like and PC-esterase domain-containing protein 1 [Amphiura filiformis]|uniref:LOW QUALITY PROTEIN: cadherin-like and PC-esterase domain-containing protein 1 n=1 Tax=Amphiura filiformis TaxID=82378 RepID=UPI003B223292